MQEPDPVLPRGPNSLWVLACIFVCKAVETAGDSANFFNASFVVVFGGVVVGKIDSIAFSGGVLRC